MSANVAYPVYPQPTTPTDDASGAKAIEVAAMLGDSVVDVKHCVDPQSGKITPKTWGLAAAGLSCVLLSAVAFGASVSNAAYNKGALDYWTHVAKKPAHAYRPRSLGTSYDWLAFGGFALGVGALAGSLSRMRRERRSPYYRIGTAPGVELPLEGAPSESFPLIAPRGDDFVMNFGAGVSGDLVVDGRTIPLAELAATGHARASTMHHGAFELPIPMGGKIRAQVGQTSFVVSGVAKPREHKTPLLAGLESRTMSYFAGSLAVHLGIVLLLSQIPVDSGTVPIDLASSELTDLRGSSTETETAPLEPQELEHGGGGSDGGPATAMRLEQGQAGTTQSQSESGHIRMKNNQVDPVLARAQAMEEARTAGILGSTSLLNGSTFADLTSQSNLSSGFDSADVWGPLYGSDGEGKGYFGYGRTGFGGGGGCTIEPCGIIGTSEGYNRIGLGKFGRDGYNGPGGPGGPGMRRRNPRVPAPTIGQPTGSGDLDKAIIRRYMKRNVDKIAYCYEKQLLAKPGIAGNIMVTFFISPNGSVKSATGSGFDPTVANCVADVVGAIQFPKPAGGGGVQVNYPFTFHAAGR